MGVSCYHLISHSVVGSLAQHMTGLITKKVRGLSGLPMSFDAVIFASPYSALESH